MSEKSLIQKAAADFAAATLAPVSFVPEKTAEYTEDAVKEMAAKGFLKVADLEEAAIVAEEFGKANASMAEVAVVANVTANVLAEYGAASDAMTGFAVYEDGVSCGGVTAEKAGDAYKITGKKIAAALGGAAEQYIVIATLGEKLAAFVVKASDVKSEKFDKLGLRSYPTADLTLDGAPAVLLSEDGAKVRAEVTAKIDTLNCFVAAGIADTACNTSVEYAKTRVQFGAPIAKIPAVQFMLAEISAAGFILEAVGEKALAAIVSGKPYIEAAAAAKLQAAKSAFDAGTNCVQIHGGTGYSREYPIERYYREMKTLFTNTDYIDYPEKKISDALLK
jgi:alkylation response protein AidB-like acyl-CoA dehydrogenase